MTVTLVRAGRFNDIDFEGGASLTVESDIDESDAPTGAVTFRFVDDTFWFSDGEGT